MNVWHLIAWFVLLVVVLLMVACRRAVRPYRGDPGTVLASADEARREAILTGSTGTK